MKHVFVLLSGGIDSTTCLHLAAFDNPGADLVGISINYGQRHFKELTFAMQSCHDLDARHRIIDLSAVVPKTMLTDPKREIPNASYDQLTGVSPTYVPFRNGLMLSAIASYASGTADEGLIYWGAHAEDAQNWAYPDCTVEFSGAMANALYIGTYHKFRLITPLQWLSKAEVIKLGNRLGVQWTDTWSCYAGGELHCGTCPTCRARRVGFIAAGVEDPTEYAT